MDRLLAALRPGPDAADAALLDRFLAGRDEAAFAELVRRHGPAVWGVCRRGLPNQADAEDAFQATFLVLVRRAGDVAGHPTFGRWLHRVARLTVGNLRRANRRRDRRFAALTHDAASADPAPAADARADVADALARLPARLRVPVELCHLQGLTRSEAAARLGCPEGTLSATLAEALRRLRARLGGAGGAAALPAGLVAATTRTAVVYALSAAPAAEASPAVAGLTDGVLRMLQLKQRVAAAVAVLAVGLTVGLALTVGAADDPPREKVTPKERPADPQPEVVKAAAKEKSFLLVGTVKTADGKAPLEGVEVTASAGIGSLMVTGETKTDKDGRFRLVFRSGVTKVGGVAIVHVRKPGWYGWAYGWPAHFTLSDQPLDKRDVPAKSTNLVPGAPSRLEFRMQPAAALRVKLVDGAGKPLAGARVSLTGDDLPPGASVIADRRTGADGAFAVQDVPRGRYRLVVEDGPGGRGSLELGSIQFRDAAEYSAVATIHEWKAEGTHASLKVTRGQPLLPGK